MTAETCRLAAGVVLPVAAAAGGVTVKAAVAAAELSEGVALAMMTASKAGVEAALIFGKATEVKVALLAVAVAAMTGTQQRISNKQRRTEWGSRPKGARVPAPLLCLCGRG